MTLSIVYQSHLVCNNPIDCVEDEAMNPAIKDNIQREKMKEIWEISNKLRQKEENIKFIFMIFISLFGSNEFVIDEVFCLPCKTSINEPLKN